MLNNREISETQVSNFIEQISLSASKWVASGRSICSYSWGEAAAKKVYWSGANSCPFGAFLIQKKVKYPSKELAPFRTYPAQEFYGNDLSEAVALSTHFDISLDFVFGAINGYNFRPRTDPNVVGTISCNTLMVYCLNSIGVRYAIQSPLNFGKGAHIGRMFGAIVSSMCMTE